jgi:hypothetical protein
MTRELATTGEIGARELRIAREQANRLDLQVPHAAEMLRGLADAVEQLRDALWRAEHERDQAIRGAQAHVTGIR